MKLLTKTIIFFLFFTGIITAQNNAFYTKANDFFSKHVANGLVNYKTICSNPAELNSLIDKIAVAEVPSAANDYKAFYINAYNLSVIKGIAANFPVKKPLDVPGFFDKKTFKIAGENLTLNAIENKKLREKYPNEPRFHFVLVCAGLGCPPIINKAYTPENVQSLLTQQTKKAINNSKFIRVNREEKKVSISQIFDWYKQDFLKHGSYIDFINKYLATPISKDFKVNFYDYDWSLNSK